MKGLSIPAALFLACLFQIDAYSSGPGAGFFLPDSVNEMTLRYRSIRGLIILPVTINDSVQVNLVLDTGCRNLILFGKKFQKLLKVSSARPVEFSGLGTGKATIGSLSLDNKVSIENVLGERIPVVIVNKNDLFGAYHNVHGVIGYDIFLKFEIELNARAQSVTFRSALKSVIPSGYTRVPMRIVDARPVMESQIFLDKGKCRPLELMIDTGSSLGLLLKTTNISEFDYSYRERVLGTGLNGPISGYETLSDRVVIGNLEIMRVPTGIVSSPWHDNASIGMEILKNYIVVLNYCRSYVCFKRDVA